MILARCADALMAVLFAPCCAACHEPLLSPASGAVCATCWGAIRPLTEPLCEVCGDALPSLRIHQVSRLCIRCARTPRVVAGARAIGSYEGTLRDILQALKYHQRLSVARPLGRLMTVSGSVVLDGADFVVPVPLHFIRRYRRGFNQAAELARHLGTPVLHALRRTRHTRTQTDLPEAQRHRNVRDAFAISRRARSRLAGAVLVVVDDVSTTGATLDACARVLLNGGAREVRALTAARAASRLPQ